MHINLVENNIIVNSTICVICSLLLLFIIIFIIFAIIMYKTFHIRCDGSSCLKYFVASDFPDLVSKPISFHSNKGQLLRGYVYNYKNIIKYKALIIFNHGIGAGHLAYTNIIYEFAKAGYLIFAYDNTGCMLSEGQTMKSMIQGLVDLDYALDYIEKDNSLNKYKKYCVGHSMGGYVSLNSLNLKKHHVDKVVSIAGFDTQTKIASTLRRKTRQRLIEPFVFIYDLLHYGKYAIYSSRSALKNTNKEVYYIQGFDDHTVLAKYNGQEFKKISTKKNNVHVELLPHKAHNCYLSLRAEQYQIDLVKKYHIFNDPILDKNIVIDYNLLTELDDELFSKILLFLDK